MYAAASTAHITKHLGKVHSLFEDGRLLLAPNINPSAHAFVNLLTPFDGAQYKKNFTDWVVHHDITFQQATSERTWYIILSGSRLAKLILL